MDNTCVLCDQPLTKPFALVDATDECLLTCKRCGRYRLPNFYTRIKPFEAQEDRPEIKSKRHLLSAVCRAANDPPLIDRQVLQQVAAGVPAEKSVSEKIELLVKWLATETHEGGQVQPIDPDNNYPVAWCKSAAECRYVFQAAVEVGYLQVVQPLPPLVVVTPKAWEWLGARPGPPSHDVFIAMAFSPDLAIVKDVIERAIRHAGYQPLRVDDDHYTGGVVDRIKALIRRSKFVVADFTLNRGGVYFEAGFAEGLGLQVINLCRDTTLHSSDPAVRLHFDVAHTIMLTWTDGQLENFEKRLVARIEAVFGHGPRTPVAPLQ
jgi:hypothetical protein